MDGSSKTAAPTNYKLTHLAPLHSRCAPEQLLRKKQEIVLRVVLVGEAAQELHRYFVDLTFMVCKAIAKLDPLKFLAIRLFMG